MKKKEAMNKDMFWDIISEARTDTKSDDLFLEKIEKSLSRLSNKQLKKYSSIFDEYVTSAYMPGIGYAGMVMSNSILTQDVFTYFLAWLVSQGKDVYLNALANPDSLASLDKQENYELELFFNIAESIYFKRNGEIFFNAGMEENERADIIKEIKYDSEIHILKSKYEIQDYIPCLCKKFYPDEDIFLIYPEADLIGCIFDEQDIWPESAMRLSLHGLLLKDVDVLLSNAVRTLESSKTIENMIGVEKSIKLIEQAKVILQQNQEAAIENDINMYLSQASLTGEGISSALFTSAMTAFMDCKPEVISRWISFANECVENGQFVDFADDGDDNNPVDRWLETLLARILKIQKSYGNKVAKQICDLSLQPNCLYPSEMKAAAEHFKKGGGPEDVGAMLESGALEGYDSFFPKLREVLGNDTTDESMNWKINGL